MVNKMRGGGTWCWGLVHARHVPHPVSTCPDLSTMFLVPLHSWLPSNLSFTWHGFCNSLAYDFAYYDPGAQVTF